MTIPPLGICTTCGGLGWLTIAAKSGYHLYKQCPACRPEPTQQEEIE